MLFPLYETPNPLELHEITVITNNNKVANIE